MDAWAAVIISLLIVLSGVLSGLLIQSLGEVKELKRYLWLANESRDSWASRCRKLEKAYTKQKQEFQMKFSNFKLSKDKNWTIACIKDGHLTAVEGSVNDLATREEAKERAKVLARENPTTEFLVIGPTDKIRADIPVITEEYVQ